MDSTLSPLSRRGRDRCDGTLERWSQNKARQPDNEQLHFQNFPEDNSANFSSAAIWRGDTLADWRLTQHNNSSHENAG